MLGSIDMDSLVAIAAGALVVINVYEKLTAIFGKKSKNLHKRVSSMEKDIADIKHKNDSHDCLIEYHKKELRLLCKGILACLKGLEEQGCNGPVHEGIKEMEEHLLDVSH